MKENITNSILSNIVKTCALTRSSFLYGSGIKKLGVPYCLDKQQSVSYTYSLGEKPIGSWSVTCKCGIPATSVINQFFKV